MHSSDEGIGVFQRKKMKVNKIYATLVALTMAAASVGAADKPATAEKVMRYAFRVAETGFDPAKVSDIYSRTVTEAIFEGLYGYDFLARPAVVKPLVADGMPVASNDFKTYTVKIKPGILFADDPAFCDANGQNCKKREVTAQDFPSIIAFTETRERVTHTEKRIWETRENFITKRRNAKERSRIPTNQAVV